MGIQFSMDAFLLLAGPRRITESAPVKRFSRTAHAKPSKLLLQVPPSQHLVLTILSEFFLDLLVKMLLFKMILQRNYPRPCV